MKITLPSFFKPLFWSYDFAKIDPEKQKSTIIINAINYGDLRHWRWLVKHYGRERIRSVLSKRQATELRPPTRRLAFVLFNMETFSHAPRSAR